MDEQIEELLLLFREMSDDQKRIILEIAKLIQQQEFLGRK